VLAFLTGVGFLIALSVDGRSANVNAFNAAVVQWPTYAASFRSLTVNVSGDGAGVVPLPAVTTEDSYPDASGLNLPIADNIHYAQTTPAGSPIAGRSFKDGARASLLFSINGTTSAETIPLFKTERKDKSTNYYKLGSLCFTVDSRLIIVGGCSKGDGWTPNEWQSCGSNDYVGFNIYVDVRSDSDPFVKAMRVTSGTLFFGVSQRDKAIVGFVLTGVCAFIFISLCCSMRGSAAETYSRTGSSVPLNVVLPVSATHESYYAQPGATESYDAQPGVAPAQGSYFAQPGYLQAGAAESYNAQPGVPPAQGSYYAQLGYAQAGAAASYNAQPGVPPAQGSYYAQPRYAQAGAAESYNVQPGATPAQAYYAQPGLPVQPPQQTAQQYPSGQYYGYPQGPDPSALGGAWR
jgi:hypothetical protein